MTSEILKLLEWFKILKGTRHGLKLKKNRKLPLKKLYFQKLFFIGHNLSHLRTGPVTREEFYAMELKVH